MGAIGFAFPVHPGKEETFRRSLRERRARTDDFAKSRKSAGITLERVFIQTNPRAWHGQVGPSLMNVYLEVAGARDSRSVLKALRSGSETDRRFLEIHSEITGIDFLSSEASVDVEHVASWSAPGKQSKERYPGLAFSVPLLRDNSKALKAFGKKYEKLGAGLAESRGAIGVVREEVFVQHTPPWVGGDLITIYVEGPQVLAKANTLRSSKVEFDKQFDDAFRALLPSFVLPAGALARAASAPIDIAQEVEWQAAVA